MKGTHAVGIFKDLEKASCDQILRGQSPLRMTMNLEYKKSTGMALFFLSLLYRRSLFRREKRCINPFEEGADEKGRIEPEHRRHDFVREGKIVQVDVVGKHRVIVKEEQEWTPQADKPTDAADAFVF